MTRKWMLLAAALLSTAATAAEATKFSKQVPIGAIGTDERVHVSNVAGSVTITIWDRREVDVQGELDSGVERVDVTRENGNVDIRVVVRDEQSWRDSAARLQIRLPPDVQLEARTVSAPISISGVRGKLRLRSVSGDIRSTIVGADVEAKSVSGDVELTGSGTPARIRASSVSGDVDLVRIGGEVEARSTSGDVELEVQGATDVRAHSVSGDVDVRGALARDADLEAESVSGRIKVGAQAPTGFRYEVTSYSGSIRNCFGDEVEQQKNRGSRLDGVRGEGKGDLRVKSHSGRVEICDR